MIVESIYHWSDKTPDAGALIQDRRRITYRSFAQAISRVRGFLHRNGCVDGGYAAIVTQSQTDFWICSLALRSLGYTTAQLPAPALLEEMTASTPMLVVFPGHSPPPPLARLCVEMGFRLLPLHIEDEQPLELNSGTQIARMGGHLLRTSGTTGDAKLVLMTPGMDGIFLRRKNEIAGIDQETVLGAFNFPPWTAAGYRWAASPWIVGGATVVNGSSDPTSVLRQPGLTHAVLVPILLQRALDQPEESFRRNDRLQLMVGGGAMTAQQVEQVHARITTNLFNLIASTEAGVITYTPIHSAADMRRHDLVADRSVEIVDEFDRPIERGVIGRIRVLQAGLPNGYHRNEAASLQSFRDGYFYTGDLAAIDDKGKLSLHGRLSDLLNIGGHKISPIEVEQKLSDKLGSPACILSCRSAAGAEELHVIIESDQMIPQEQVMALLTQWTKYVSSIQIHNVASFPRTETGKLMRDSLRIAVIGSSPGGP